MLWIRNGYVEFAIILNHKNVQFMFTLPLPDILPIMTAMPKDGKNHFLIEPFSANSLL